MESQKIRIEFIVIAGIVVAALAFFGNQSRNDGVNAAAQSRNFASTAKPKQEIYKIHFRAYNLNQLVGTRDNPSQTAVFVDGFKVLVEKKATHIDRWFAVHPGHHLVMLRMWDAKGKEVDKKYSLNVGKKPTMKPI